MKLPVSLILLVASLAGCKMAGHRKDACCSVQEAVAVLHPTAGSSVAGTVRFAQMEGYVLVRAEVTGLAPGEHGFHIHEWGDCACADGVCAGNHFNPTEMPHGGPDAEKRHAGDLGNLSADASGKAVYERKDAALHLGCGPGNPIGRAVIVHAKPDDFATQPTGNAGARLACGAIGIAKPAP